jgi:isopenicillin-N epimerase
VTARRSTGPDAAELARHWRLEPGLAYLNHGAFGACPRPVLDRQRRLRAELERQPVRFLARRLADRLDRARQELGAFLHADPADLAAVANATTGVNSVLRSLDLGPGDELLTTDHEYPASRNALDFVAARSGARVVVARIPFPIEVPEQAVAAVAAAVTGRTRLLLIDHVTSPTGVVLPLERIAAEMAGRGVEVLVDGAHAPGMLPLDLGALAEAGVTYYTGNCHKWLCAPKGAAFLWVRRDRQPRIRPLVISHGATVRRPGRSRFHDEFDWTGTTDPTAFLSVPAALGFVGGLLPGGWDEVRSRNRALALAGRAVVAEALGVAPPVPESMIGSLAALPLPDAPCGPAGEPLPAHEADPLQAELLERWGVEVPVVGWPGPPKRLIRLSAQLYNHLPQYRRLAEALGEMIQR